MDVVFLVLGFVFGLLLAVVYVRIVLKTKLEEAKKLSEADLEIFKEKNNLLDKEYAILTSSFNMEQQQLQEIRMKLNEEVLKRKNIELKSERLAVEKNGLEENLSRINDALRLKEEKLDLEINTRIFVEKKLTELSVENESLKEKLENERKQLSEIQNKFSSEFENLANKILKKNTLDFSSSSVKNIGDLLNPLKEKLQSFEEKVENTYEKGLRDQSDLKAELLKLHDLSMRLDQDAKNLTNALKSDTKKQGNWGEIILERVLERSGLSKNQEYFVQQTARNEAGEMLRPDVVVKLPDNKHIIIDSKVSLTAYTQYVSEDDDAKRNAFLKLHLTSVKKHIKELSSKSYDSLNDFNSPDFVLMFMPIEPAFALAVQSEPELFNFAWKERVVIVSPTTLLATLRTIASIWKYEKQNQNALEIAERGGKLYDKFEGFVKDMETIGVHIQKAGKSYDDAHKKLTSGSGNILRQVEQLKKMGVTSKKSLPEQYLIDNE
jgi:DNA recombination protein RmuC